MSTAPAKHASYITRGILRGKKVAYSRSTLAVYAVCTVHRVDKLVSEGYKNQDLIDKLFERQLIIEGLSRKFLFRQSERVSEALLSPLLLSE